MPPILQFSWAAPAGRWQWLVELFAVDLRALAALRMGAGLLLLADLVNRWPDLAAHYSDDGLLPRADRWNLLVDFGLSGWSSLQMLSGAVWFQGALFLLTALAAVCLTLGYRTRPATVICFVLLFSLHARNPLVLQCGDTLFRCLLFWGMFLPLGAVWSMDASRSQHCGRKPSRRMASAATVALLLQLCFVYLFTALLKTDPSWRSDFSAVHYVLHHDHFTSAWGYRLLEYPALLPALTLGSWLLEWVGPFLLFWPLATGRVRVLVVLAFMSFHVGLAATMELGLFSYYCICYWLVFLPSGVWDAVEAGLRRLTGRHREAGGEGAHSQIGRLFGDLATSVERRTWRSLAVWFLLAYVTLLNIRRLDGDWFATIGRGPLRHVARATGLDQCWCMFATGPHDFGGWLELRGRLADGRAVNLMSPGEPLATTAPALVSDMYPSHRWRRYLLYLHELPDMVQRKAAADYLRRRWERQHPGGPAVLSVELVNMARPTAAPGLAAQAEAVVRPVLLFRGEYPSSPAITEVSRTTD